MAMDHRIQMRFSSRGRILIAIPFVAKVRSLQERTIQFPSPGSAPSVSASDETSVCSRLAKASPGPQAMRPRPSIAPRSTSSLRVVGERVASRALPAHKSLAVLAEDLVRAHHVVVLVLEDVAVERVLLRPR